MSEKDMELYGVSYHKCNSCSFEPLIWNMGIGDAVCENCGKWQEEDNEWVQCNWCMKVYEDLDIKECQDCQTDSYLANVSGSKYNSNLKKEDK